MDLQSHLALLQMTSSFENILPLVHCASTMIVQREAELQCGGNAFASISKQLACLIHQMENSSMATSIQPSARHVCTSSGLGGRSWETNIATLSAYIWRCGGCWETWETWQTIHSPPSLTCFFCYIGTGTQQPKASL